MDIRANGILIDAPGPITQLKLDRVSDYISAYKSHGVNTIVLTAFIPVDPESGVVRQQFMTPDLYGKVAVTPEYMGAFTDLALAKGVSVIWKPQFIVDDGRDQNVNDYSVGKTFYPSGNGFNTSTFLSGVKEFWREWSQVAERHHVSMLVLGTEQGYFAYPPYESAWREIIQTAREHFSGKLTYAENHYAPLPDEGRVDFWGALDYIGIDDYSPIGNGTDSTPYSQAYANVFNSSVFSYNNATRFDVPGVLYNLHLKYDKPIFFTEFATDSLAGAMNDPAASNFAKAVSFSEQADYFRAKFDVYHNYDWVEGIGIFDIVNEASPSPSSPDWLAFFERGLKNNMEWLNKPTAEVIKFYWQKMGLPPPIHASSAVNPGGGFAGTESLPDTLVGGFQNDYFDKLGGVYKIYGGDGRDTAEYRGTVSNFTITLDNDHATVVDKTGSQGRGTVVEVERLKFADTIIALDTDGNAGQAYRLYQAAFHRTPDKAGLSFWVNQLDHGTSLSSAAGNFITSNEFKAAFGNPGSLSNSAFLDVLYTNILGRAPEASGKTFWQGQLDQGFSRAGALASFSESPENVKLVGSAIQNGITLDPHYLT